MTLNRLAILAFLIGCGGHGRGGLTTKDNHAAPAHKYGSATTTRTRKAPARQPRRVTQKKNVRPAGPLGKTTAERCAKLLPAAKTISKSTGVDLGLLMGVARIESRFNPRATNRRSGAAGLMQIMPSTGKYFKCGNLMNAKGNLKCGARVLRRYIKYFDGSMTYGIAAYHSGPVSPKKRKKAGKLPKNFYYVEKVLQARSRFLRKGCT